MSNAKQILKFNVSETSSKWREKAEWRRTNKQWLNKSQKIAFAILNCLDKNEMTQTEFADKMIVSQQYISKIVKGSENLSLETISKIESVLDIELISVNTFSVNYNLNNSVGSYFSMSNFESIGKSNSIIQAVDELHLMD